MRPVSTKILVLSALLLLTSALTVRAAEKTSEYNLESGKVGIKGYDPVSYYAPGGPKEGDKKISTTFEGVVYRFTSDDHRKKFTEDPHKYLPAYGGWCATAMGKGYKFDIDPTNYQITDGRVYLFYKGWRGDALPEWVKDEAKLKPVADETWKKIAGE